MAGLLYFIPNEKRKIYSTQADRLPPELSHLHGASWTASLTERGPGDTPGLVLALSPAPRSGGTEARPCRYNPEEQTWFPILREDGSMLFFGWLNESPPGPADVQREHTLSGESLIHNKQKWTIPVVLVRPPVEVRSTLPSHYVKGLDGWYEIYDTKGYEKIIEEAASHWERLLEEIEDPTEELIDFACHLLQINYRLGDHEASALGLLNKVKVLEIRSHALGLTGYAREEDFVKKKDTTASDS